MTDYVLTNHEVTKDTLQQIYRNKLQASFAKFARSLTLAYTGVKIHQISEYSGQPPAWSNDKDITLHYYEGTGSVLASDNLIRLKGLLIHELSHLLFTPRSRTDLAKWVRTNNLWDAFNILEDNRIENMMVAKMSGIAPWLVHTVTAELLKNPADITSALPLVWGRKYLPKDVRVAALNSWPKAAPDELARIIDQYIKLNLADTKANDTAKNLIKQFANYLSGSNAKSSMHQYGSDPTPSSDLAATQSKGQQDKLLNQVDELDENSGTESDGSANDNDSASTDLQQAVANAHSAASEQVYEDVKSTIQNVRDVESSADVTNDYADKQERNKINPVYKFSITKEPAMPEATVASRKFARELQELRAAHDPGWIRKTETGRLNVRDYMMGGDIDEIFDQWSDGNQEVTDIECVILLDVSGSMNDMLTPAYNAMWSVKRALDSINASTTVIQFGTYGEVLYGANDVAGPTIQTARGSGGGGTAPFYSIRRAKQILEESPRAIKIFLMITDGEWANPNQCDQVILGMRLTGVLTGLVFLMPEVEPGQSVWWLPRDDQGKYVINGHSCEVVTALDTPLDIVSVAKSLTSLAQRKVLN